MSSMAESSQFGDKIEIGKATLEFRRMPKGGVTMGIYGSGFMLCTKSP